MRAAVMVLVWSKIYTNIYIYIQSMDIVETIH